MVRQRARRYDEIDAEYILFCDDDVYLPPHAIQELFDALIENHGDCIAPNVFQHHKASLKNKIRAGLYSETFPSFFARYAVRIRMSSHFSYAVRPRRVMPTQSFAGPCFIAKKSSFLAANCAILSYYSAWTWHLLMALLLWMVRKKKHELGATVSGLRDARKYVKSEEYLKLPVWYQKTRK